MKDNNTLIEVKIDPDTTIWVNTFENDILNTDESDASFKIPSMDGVFNAIQKTANKFSNTLKVLSPDKASIEFNVEVTLKSGKMVAVLFGGETKSGIKVKLEWKKKEMLDDTSASQ